MLRIAFLSAAKSATEAMSVTTFWLLNVCRRGWLLIALKSPPRWLNYVLVLLRRIVIRLVFLVSILIKRS